MNKIAVFVGSNNETIAFDTTGMIKVFLKKENEWDIVQEVPLEINESMGLSTVREGLTRATKLIEDCTIIVGKKVYGISYNVFETLGFVIWEFEGQPQTFLDCILEHEQEYKKQKEQAIREKKQENSSIMQMGEGYYTINLQEIQSKDRSISSKQIIIPFLKEEVFKQVDIICSHVPPWIEKEASKYGLKMKMEQVGTDSYKVVLLSM